MMKGETDQKQILLQSGYIYQKNYKEEHHRD